MNLHGKRILKISSVLKKYTKLHTLLKKIYFKLNYFIYADKDFTYDIENGLLERLTLDEKTNFFFGYYHNSPWSFDDRFIIINSIVNDVMLNINIWDTQESKLINIDNTVLWNFQQGPMAGWFPDKHIIYYNKLIDDTHKTILHDLSLNTKKIFDSPIQAIHPDGMEYLSINYDRLHTINSDYGYSVKCKKYHDKGSGIWQCDLKRNDEPKLIISKGDLSNIDCDFQDNSNHEFNHCIYSEKGDYFIFIYRYANKNHNFSKLILADLRTSPLNLKCINDSFVSHMCWIDQHNIFYFGDSINGSIGYYKYNMSTSESIKIMPENLIDGHPSINPDKKWIVLDTYPDKESNSHLYLYNLETTQLLPVGKFRSNINLSGFNRCDLHPRWNRAGTHVMIDNSCFEMRTPLIINLEETLYEEK